MCKIQNQWSATFPTPSISLVSQKIVWVDDCRIFHLLDRELFAVVTFLMDRLVSMVSMVEMVEMVWSSVDSVVRLKVGLEVTTLL